MRDVRDYYDRATRRFLIFGHGRSESVIHRAIWGPGVESRIAAMHFVHRLVLGEIERGSFLRVVDLGCGVGGSIRYLAERFPAEYWGITISEKQAAVAKSTISREFPGVAILLGDMVEIDDLLPTTNRKTLYYAIESAIHLSDVSLLFASLQNAKTGDYIVLIDDMLRRTPMVSEERILARFRSGWHAKGLTTREHILSEAERFGFLLDREQDLSQYLELRRPRDRLIRIAMPVIRLLGKKSAWFSSLVGGDALQRGLLSGLIAHAMLVFRKI